MPLVRVELPTGKAADYRAAMDEAIQKAMHAALKVPLEGLRLEDLVVNLVEMKRENWSFGRREAQLA